MPDAKSAVARLDATYAQVVGAVGEAKIDYLGDRGRVRGEVSELVAAPASLRFAITADVIGSAGEIASDGHVFEADDKAHGRFLTGLARPCAIARLTQIPLPSRELVPMLWGMRPAIDGAVVRDSIQWDDGHYVVTLATLPTHDAPIDIHELDLAPYPSDWDKPWNEQRMRLVGVTGWNDDGGAPHVAYRVTMKDHAIAKTAAPLVDPDGLSADVPPSGPSVEVDIPRAIHVEVPSKGSDVVFHYTHVELNPPLRPGAFALHIPTGLPVEHIECE